MTEAEKPNISSVPKYLTDSELRNYRNYGSARGGGTQEVDAVCATIDRLQEIIDSIWDVALDRDMETGVAIRCLIDPDYAKWGADV